MFTIYLDLPHRPEQSGKGALFLDRIKPIAVVHKHQCSFRPSPVPWHRALLGQLLSSHPTQPSGASERGAAWHWPESKLLAQVWFLSKGTCSLSTSLMNITQNTAGKGGGVNAPHRDPGLERHLALGLGCHQVSYAKSNWHKRHLSYAKGVALS